MVTQNPVITIDNATISNYQFDCTLCAVINHEKEHSKKLHEDCNYL